MPAAVKLHGHEPGDDPIGVVGNPLIVSLGAGDGTEPGSQSVPLAISESWRVAYRYDEDANDSDKKITVPANEEWQVQWVWVELTTTATVGTRQLELQILDSSDDVVGRFVAGVTQAASLTYHYLFGMTVDLLAVRDGDFLSVATPQIFLAEGWSLRIFDNNAVAVAADDMIVQIPIAFRST